MILARETPEFLINCCCPGWVDTKLGAQAGQPPKTVGKYLCLHRTLVNFPLLGCILKFWVKLSQKADIFLLEEGALIPIRLGFDNIGDISGEFWANDSTNGKGNGKVAMW